MEKKVLKKKKTFEMSITHFLVLKLNQRVNAKCGYGPNQVVAPLMDNLTHTWIWIGTKVYIHTCMDALN
jgi:hypothetical protein